MENSKIEWTDHTFNPWWGCMKVSEGCKNCYAETLDGRFNGGHWRPGSTRKSMTEAYWQKPLQWNRAAEKSELKAKVFCASMADVFEGHPDTLPHLTRLFNIIEQTPHLTWQLLTKRPENIKTLLPDRWKEKMPPNVWLGASVENQATAEQRIPHLLWIDAPVLFLSCEPLLSHIDLTNINIDGNQFNVLKGAWYTEDGELGGLCNSIDWVIVGGESGLRARPIHPGWVKSLRDQCSDIGVPFFFKQWGEYWPGERGRLYQERMLDFTDGQTMVKVGKKAAGRKLDGVEHNGFPDTI